MGASTGVAAFRRGSLRPVHRHPLIVFGAVRNLGLAVEFGARSRRVHLRLFTIGPDIGNQRPLIILGVQLFLIIVAEYFGHARLSGAASNSVDSINPAV